jgi:hypothetical protein
VSLCNKTLRVAIIAAAICLQACAGGHSDTSLDVIGVDGGTPEVHAHWGYTSGKVDVDIDVTTVESPACATTARLVIDKALSSAETYRLHETDCKTLRITREGDFVLFDAPTGNDWTAQDLDVDTDHERITLGPLHDEVSKVTYEFTLVAPECPDDHDCDCPRLDRKANREVRSLDLGRRCD